MAAVPLAGTLPAAPPRSFAVVSPGPLGPDAAAKSFVTGSAT